MAKFLTDFICITLIGLWMLGVAGVEISLAQHIVICVMTATYGTITYAIGIITGKKVKGWNN